MNENDAWPDIPAMLKFFTINYAITLAISKRCGGLKVKPNTAAKMKKSKH